MPVCVVPVQSGGALVLTLDPTNTDISSCTYIIEDGASNAWRELGNMSIENATQIGVSMGVVWAIAWGFKQMVRLVRDSDTSNE